jgi:hypothetical protein
MGGTVRSDPVWSPDNKFMAWTEDGSSDEKLIVYDLAQKRTKVLATYGKLDVVPSQPIWGTLGLALFDNADQDFHIQVYDAQGNVLVSIPTAQYSPTLRWVSDGDRTYLMAGGLASASGEPPAFFDLDTRQQTQRSDLFELYSIASPNGLSIFRTGDCQSRSCCPMRVPLRGLHGVR